MAWHPSLRAFESLYVLSDGMNPRILSVRSGPPAMRMTSRVYPIMYPTACLGCMSRGRVMSISPFRSATSISFPPDVTFTMVHPRATACSRM